MSRAAARERLSAKLDPEQLRAVQAGRGTLCVLAGAGSGKTRVLTHRAAWMSAVEGIEAERVLAVAFTNEAVEEMRARLGKLVGTEAASEMVVATFHAAAWRLVVHPYRALYPRPIAVIYSAEDALSACRRALRELRSAERPREVLGRIGWAKAHGLSPGQLARRGSDGARIAAVWRRYRELLRSAGALDFEDILVAAVWLLEERAEIRRAVGGRFDCLVVDEYQDASPVQHRLVELIAPGDVMVVGDDDQCLVEGTLVTMADGTEKPIERVAVGEEVLSSYGTATMRGARVSRTARLREPSEGIKIVTKGGRAIVSTPEHEHFAGFKAAATPQAHVTYLMWKRSHGFRVGKSRMYTADRSRGHLALGFQYRCVAEHADAVWVLGVHESDAEARYDEALIAARYGLPVLPFFARPDRRRLTLVGNQALLDRLYGELDSESGARRLLVDRGLLFEHPHHVAANSGHRRWVTVTMCADPRGAKTLHRVSFYGGESSVRELLEGAGIAVRPTGKGTWRIEKETRDLGAAMALGERIGAVTGAPMKVVARMGPAQAKGPERRALPVTPAAQVRPGMAMFTPDGYDVVSEVRRVRLKRPVYDLDVENTHNFVANGLITHNSIYGFRGGDARALRSFERRFPGARRLTLSRNYRSAAAIVQAAARLVAHSPDRPPRELRAVSPGGRVELRRFRDRAAEAEGVVGWCEARIEGGAAPAELAVLARTARYLGAVEQLLVARGVAYRLLGRRRLAEHAEIRDVIALLSGAVIGWHREALARAALRVPGLGERTLERVFAQAERAGETPADLLREAERIEGRIAPRQRAGAAELGRRLSDVCEALGRGVRAGVVCAIRRSGWAGELRGAGTEEAEGRRERLRALCALAERFDREGEVEVEEFLAQLALAEEGERGGSGVTLGTIHAAKGREWERVFLIGAVEGELPHRRALGEPDGIAAERCVAYVAMTRARSELCVGAPERVGGREAAVSRFVTEAGLR